MGREALEKKLPRRRVQSGYNRFEKWGFWSVFAATLMPPPFPIAAAWLTAGAMRYSVTKFLGAVASGRSVRYSIVAYLASRHSEFILALFSKYRKPGLIAVACSSLVVGLYGTRRYWQLRREKKDQQGPPKR